MITVDYFPIQIPFSYVNVWVWVWSELTPFQEKNIIYLTNTVISIIIILVIIFFTIVINVTAYIMNSIFFSHWYQFHSPGFLWTVARLPDLLLTVLTVMQLGSSENALIVNKTLPGVSFKLMRQWKIILINIY